MFSFTVDSILSKKMINKNQTNNNKNNDATFHHTPTKHQITTATILKCPNMVAVSKYGSATLDDYHFGRVTVNLDNYMLWSMFRKVGTEMVITKAGRRMFPALRFSVSGLHPKKCYSIAIEISPADNYRYKYHDSEWCITGKAYPEAPRKYQTCVHTDSPTSGAKWCSNIVSFHKLKITNNTSKNSTKQIILNSLQKYQTRLRITEMTHDVIDTQFNSDMQPTMTFEFPETTFVAVTAYQSEQITQLKIDNNPFAKGFRDPTPAEIERTRLLNPSLFNMLVSNRNEKHGYHLPHPPRLSTPPCSRQWGLRSTHSIQYHPYHPRPLKPPFLMEHQNMVSKQHNARNPHPCHRAYYPWPLTANTAPNNNSSRAFFQCACCKPPIVDNATLAYHPQPRLRKHHVTNEPHRTRYISS